jgi:hypothetical protein
MDEIRLWVHPIILGKNGPTVPHFLECPASQFKLAISEALPSGNGNFYINCSNGA